MEFVEDNDFSDDMIAKLETKEAPLDTLCESPEIWTEQNWSQIFGTYNLVEHNRKRIKILHGCHFEGWPLNSANKPISAKKGGMVYYIIITTYQKNWRPILPSYISGLIKNKVAEN